MRPFSSQCQRIPDSRKAQAKDLAWAGLGACKLEGLCALGVYSGGALYYVGASTCQFAPKP